LLKIVKNWNKKKREKNAKEITRSRRKPKEVTKGGRERERERVGEYLVGESKEAWNTWGEKMTEIGVLKDSKRLELFRVPRADD